MLLDVEREAASARLRPHWKPDDHLLTVLARNAREHPDTVALRERDHGIWQEYSWSNYLDTVLAFAAGLEMQGVAAGDILLIIGDNRPNLYFAMLGAIALRAVPSPAYSDTPPDELAGQLIRENICFAVAEDQEQVDKLILAREKHPQLRRIIYDDPRGLASDPPIGTASFVDVAAAGRERLEQEPALRDALIARPNIHDVAILLHSSGTTATPKGVPLKHGHLLSGVRNAAAAGYFHEGEVHMAYLPIAWVGDFAFSVVAALELRFVVNIPEAQETALHDMREIAPTLYFSSPRAWSAMLTRVQVGIAESTPLKRRLYELFMPFAIELERRRLEGQKPGFLARLTRALGEFLMYRPIKDHLGLVRVARPYTAGEAIGEDVFLFFRALGLDLRQFYGQTETCALAVAQSPGDISLTTVGRPFPGIELKIDDKGEILIRADNVFDGYFQDDAATAEALRDGWLHTGDAGQFEEDGALVVLGRVSEIVRTADGRRYIPTYIENRLKFSQFVKDVCVIGAGRAFIVAIVCIDFEAVGQWAQENAIPYTSYADLSQKPKVYDLIQRLIEEVNAKMPEGLEVTRFVNLHKEFDPDDGEVTRTRKLRRDLIDERYAEIIEAIYDGQDAVDYEARITYETGQTGIIARRLAIRTAKGGG